MFIFQLNLGHVTPQIDHLGKTNTVLRGSVPLYEVSEDTDLKMFNLSENLGMEPLKSFILEKMSTF